MTAVAHDSLSHEASTEASDSGHGRLMLGLDIGGTKIAAGVVDEGGGVSGFLTEPTLAERGPRDGLERLFELGRQAVAAATASWDEIDGIGIGCGGPLDSASGLLIAPLHLPDWTNLPIAQLAAEALGRPAVLDNDATAAAAAEFLYGAGRGTLNMVYLTISTGVGGGVVLDGKLHRGTSGNGGELGHVTVDWRGRVCGGCGRRGCLEAYVSGTSIAERAAEAGMHGATAADVVEAARAGLEPAATVWAESCEALACGILSIANLFEPELVVIGGGVSRAGDLLLAPVRELVQAQSRGPLRRPMDIVTAQLGDVVGVAGAAAVAYERIAPKADGRR
jgi:glucokinase